MSEKTLKIKRVFVYTIYNSLRNVPPKEYPTTGEIKETISGVLPAFRDHVSEYLEMQEKAVDLSDKVALKEIGEKEARIRVDELNVEWRKYNKKHGKEICEVKLSEEAFKILKIQFEREKWGTAWAANIDEFDELTKIFAEAGK